MQAVDKKYQLRKTGLTKRSLANCHMFVVERFFEKYNFRHRAKTVDASAQKQRKKAKVMNHRNRYSLDIGPCRHSFGPHFCGPPGRLGDTRRRFRKRSGEVGWGWERAPIWSHLLVALQSAVEAEQAAKVNCASLWMHFLVPEFTSKIIGNHRQIIGTCLFFLVSFAFVG